MIPDRASLDRAVASLGPECRTWKGAAVRRDRRAPEGGAGGSGRGRDRLPVGPDDVPLATKALAVDVACLLLGGEVVQRHAVEGDLLGAVVGPGDRGEVLGVEARPEGRCGVG